MAKELDVLTDLKQFEQAQIKKVETGRDTAAEKLQKARESSGKNLENEKDKIRKANESAVLKAREGALKSAQEYFTEYRKKQAQLEKSYNKNFGKAVNQVLAELTK